jgi:hypothetical protein
VALVKEAAREHAHHRQMDTNRDRQLGPSNYHTLLGQEGQGLLADDLGIEPFASIGDINFCSKALPCFSILNGV